MNIAQPFSTAITALRRNKTRSILTMLGIVIGIAAVITMMEIGSGVKGQIETSISNMGSNMLMISPTSIRTGGVSTGSGTGITLTSADCDAIIRECPSVKAATPVVRGTAVQAVYGNKNWNPSQVASGNEQYFDVNEWELAEGEFFTALDVNTAACVCMLGQTVATELFGTDSPVGQTIRLNNVIFTVRGTLAPKGANLMGMDQNDLIVIPWTTMRNRLSRGGGMAATASSSSNSYSRGDRYPTKSVQLYPSRDATQTKNYLMPIRFNNINQIMVAATDANSIQDAVNEISELLRRRHKLEDHEEDDFEIRDMTELLNTFTQTSELMTSLLLIVALISLIVGGVGIMNIMLVSVTERTREIGLRMAVGAKGKDILIQFLVESLILCLLGGLLGIGGGRLCSTIVSSMNGWPIAASAGAIAMAVAVSATIGVCFGFYPAWRAARLNPIDALRYE